MIRGTGKLVVGRLGDESSGERDWVELTREMGKLVGTDGMEAVGRLGDASSGVGSTEGVRDLSSVDCEVRSDLSNDSSGSKSCAKAKPGSDALVSCTRRACLRIVVRLQVSGPE
jgi:hypothetical protein